MNNWANTTLLPEKRNEAALQYEQPILNGLIKARDQMLSSIPSSQQSVVNQLLSSYQSSAQDEITVSKKALEAAGTKLQMLLSARFALALDASYAQYRQKLASGADLSDMEQTEKRELDSCAQFSLR